MCFGNDRDAYFRAKDLGVVAYQEEDLPQYAPDFPVRAFVILRKRTYPDRLSSVLFAASGHTHYAWGGEWDWRPPEGVSIPPWIPFIRDYRYHFVIFFELDRAESEAQRTDGKVVLAFLNSKRIVAQRYKQMAWYQLEAMNSARRELMGRHDALLADSDLINNMEHIKAMTDSLETISVCHEQISQMADPKSRKSGYKALLSFSKTTATAADLYTRSFLALQMNESDEAQKLLKLAGDHLEEAGVLYERAVVYLDG